MLNKMNVVVVSLAAVLTFGMVVIAQTPAVAERFTFVPANAPKAGPAGDGRMQIVINHWSPDSERDRLLSALKEGGSDKLAESLWAGPFAGFVDFPGQLHYTIRFAYRMPRADRGEDVILGTESPVWLWWDPALGAAPTATSLARGTVIQLQLNADGRGEGKLSVGTKVSVTKDGRGFALEDYAKQPLVLTDVQRERSTS